MGRDSVLRHLPGEGPSSAWVLADLCPKPSGETTGTKTSRSLRGVSWEQRLKTPQQKRSKGRGQKTQGLVGLSPTAGRRHPGPWLCVIRFGGSLPYARKFL